jgi:hypothetical protein
MATGGILGESMFHFFASSSGLFVFRGLLVVFSDGLGFALHASKGGRLFDTDNRGESSLSFPILLYQAFEPVFQRTTSPSRR